MLETSYTKITGAQLVSYIVINNSKVFVDFEIVDDLYISNENIASLNFLSCKFKNIVKIEGNIGSGAEFHSCVFEDDLIFENISSVYQKYNMVGRNASLTFNKCKLQNLSIYNSFLEKGIQIINNSVIGKLFISGLATIQGTALNIKNSIVEKQFDLFDFKIVNNADITIKSSQINCFSRFENIITSGIHFNDTKFSRFYIYGSTINGLFIIDKSEFSDKVEIDSTSCSGDFGLYDSIFKKEFSMTNIDIINSIQSHINHYIIQSCNFESGFHALNSKPDFYPDATIVFSNSLKGTIIFESINFNKVILQGHNNGLSLTFDTCKFNSFQSNNVTNNQTIRLSNCDALKSGEDSELSITNSNLGKMNLLGCDLSSFEIVRIKSSFISEIQFANIKWFNDHSLKESDDQNKETYRQLKLAAEKQGDTVTALNFRSKELFFYQKMLFASTSPSPLFRKLKYIVDFLFWLPKKTILFLKYFWNYIANLIDPSKTLSDRIILFLGRATNNFGTNWSRPILLIIFITFLFYFAITISLSPNISWSFNIFNVKNTIGELKSYYSIYFHLLNPTHDLNRILSSPLFQNPIDKPIPSSVYAFDLIHRIIYAFLLYQLVVAFRKFAK